MPFTADVFLTGASGFVGSAVLRALVAAGHTVQALVRQSSRFDDLRGPQVEFCYGDLRDRESIAKAMAGNRYVFHVAADYRLWARRPADIFTANVAGTRNVMEAAARAGVERIVYTSSVATLTLHPDGTPADEGVPLPEAQGIGAYKRSKIAAERLVLAMAAQGLPVVIVNPSTPIGRRDLRPTPTGRIVVEAASGRIPAFVDSGLNLVHVDDVAAGHLAALARGTIGERYILGGENVLLSQMLADITALVGRPAPSIRLPWYATLPIACVAEAAAFFTGREPLATLDGVRMARHRMFFTSAKAERDLGYRARAYQQGLADAVRWFSDHGYLRARSKPAA
jgi:dihydroflavonol-4-reductase